MAEQQQQAALHASAMLMIRTWLPEWIKQASREDLEETGRYFDEARKRKHEELDPLRSDGENKVKQHKVLQCEPEIKPKSTYKEVKEQAVTVARDDHSPPPAKQSASATPESVKPQVVPSSTSSNPTIQREPVSQAKRDANERKPQAAEDNVIQMLLESRPVKKQQRQQQRQEGGNFGIAASSETPQRSRYFQDMMQAQPQLGEGVILRLEKDLKRIALKSDAAATR